MNPTKQEVMSVPVFFVLFKQWYRLHDCVFTALTQNLWSADSQRFQAGPCHVCALGAPQTNTDAFKTLTEAELLKLKLPRGQSLSMSSERIKAVRRKIRNESKSRWSHEASTGYLCGSINVLQLLYLTDRARRLQSVQWVDLHITVSFLLLRK